MPLFKFIIIHIYRLFELASFWVAVWAYPHLRNSYMKWVPYFLGFIVLSETATNIFRISFYANYLTSIIETCFYGHIFFQLAATKRTKWLVQFFMISSITGYFVCFVFLDANIGFAFYYAKMNVVFSFFITSIALNYLYQYVLIEKNANLLRDPGAWIGFGVIIFFSAYSLMQALYSYIVGLNLRIFGVSLHNMTARVLSVILYSCLAVAVLKYLRNQHGEMMRLGEGSTGAVKKQLIS